ncbi:MAG TPA: S41 family peptidase, partial [Pedobacter sp.]
MRFINYRLLLSLVLGINIFTSCKKADVTPPPTGGGGGGVSVSKEDLIKDSTLLYARDIYLWYNQIPASFNPRSYADPNKIMEALRQYSTEPGFSAPVDRWSFAMKQSEWNNISSGISVDFGFSVFFLNANDLRVKFVERASPAGKAGIRRGWRITKINGSTNINANDQSSLDMIINAVFNSTQASFTFLKPDGTSIDIPLTATTYQEQPVMLDSVYTINSKKVGYMVFNSFLVDTTQIYNEFSRVFNRFATQNVGDVIIDLRYNGGGYVSIQEKLANYLAPLSANGKLMSVQKYNDKYSQYNVSTNFRKTGSLNLSRVFFIISSSTASASEMLINNLTPYIEVKMIGRNSTHGKPVGYFPIPVGDWYIFPVSSKNTNASGAANYYNGFAPNAVVADAVDKDWGDITEASLASA